MGAVSNLSTLNMRTQPAATRVHSRGVYGHVALNTWYDSCPGHVRTSKLFREDHPGIAVLPTHRKIFLPTVMFARSMNSSTKAFVSFRAYICTSVGFWLSLSRTKRTWQRGKCIHVKGVGCGVSETGSSLTQICLRRSASDPCRVRRSNVSTSPRHRWRKNASRCAT